MITINYIVSYIKLVIGRMLYVIIICKCGFPKINSAIISINESGEAGLLLSTISMAMIFPFNSLFLMHGLESGVHPVAKQYRNTITNNFLKGINVLCLYYKGISS